MIVLAGMVLGAAYGATSARKKGGKPVDALQWAAAYGIAFSLLGLFVTIFLEKTI
jgi:hypothetical protein